jgi:NtrC-family two-component system response regulator AlgB
MEQSEQQSPPGSLNVLVVDDEINIRKMLAICLETDGHSVVTVSNAADALAESARQSFDLALVDLRLGIAEEGLALIPELIAQSPWMKVVIITAHGSIDSAVETMKRGAVDYLLKPFTPAQVKLVAERVARVAALERKVAGLQGMLGQDDGPVTLKSSNAPMQRMINLAAQVAKSDTTVLICGPSGTGKGVLAKAIHSWSPRASRPFATVSCPSLSAQLLESELFGHVRGAFTGAVRDNPGRVAACEGGTIFLDEIGELPLELQPKLLRFVQDRQYERVGESRTRRADVRVIAATNADLEQAVRAGRFREDLYYRIKVVELDLPPLSERPEDVVELAQGFLAELTHGKPIEGFTDQALEAMKKYRWPGNVRELRNVIERAVIFASGQRIGVEHLPKEMEVAGAASVEVGQAVSLGQLEEQHIRRVLARSKSLEEAAATLNIDLATLYRRRKKYGI